MPTGSHKTLKKKPPHCCYIKTQFHKTTIFYENGLFRTKELASSGKCVNEWSPVFFALCLTRTLCFLIVQFPGYFSGWASVWGNCLGEIQVLDIRASPLCPPLRVVESFWQHTRFPQAALKHFQGFRVERNGSKSILVKHSNTQCRKCATKDDYEADCG